MNPKDLVEIMRQNDAPFGNISVYRAFVGRLREGKKYDAECVRSFRKGYHEIVGIYKNIDWSVQTEETGINVLKGAQRVLNELTPILESVFQRTETNAVTIQDIPERAGELLIELQECKRLYEKLPAYQTYRKLQTNWGGLTRAEWFKQGKPRIENYDFSIMESEGS